MGERSRAEEGRFRVPRSAVWLGVLLCATAPVPVSTAGPEGETVVHGEASLGREGDVTTIHAGDDAIIHFDSFDILSHETVRFVQPSETARVLNRVLSDD